MAGVSGAWQVRQIAAPPPPAAAEEVIGAGMGATVVEPETDVGSTPVAEDDDAIEVAANPPSLSTAEDETTVINDCACACAFSRRNFDPIPSHYVPRYRCGTFSLTPPVNGGGPEEGV